MQSFLSNKLLVNAPSHAVLGIVRKLGEHLGRHELYSLQAPQLLETLRQVAVIASTESSNRIEGVVASRQRIVELVNETTTPMNRSEMEIAGYRFVLSQVHASARDMPFTVNLVLQLHRDLYKYLPGFGGEFKRTNNVITERDPSGSEKVRITPVPSHLTNDAMERLHGEFNRAWDAGPVDRLLLIPAYVLDFLCIHPFADGNGWLARLLSLLLLYKAGVEVGRYISLEQRIEETKEQYYDTLWRSSQGWHDGTHPLGPWTEYFLGVVLEGAYQKFEGRVQRLENARGAKTSLVRDSLQNLPKRFKLAELQQLCPGVSPATVRKVLNELRTEGLVRSVSRGRDAQWEKVTGE